MTIPLSSGTRPLCTAALDRVVYLLDRSLADGYRIRAFQRALAVIGGLDDDELAERIDNGTLTQLDGIGDATATVIAEAAGGTVGTYLAKLEAETLIVRTPGGDQLVHELRGDCHLHSTWSDGSASPLAMAEAARALGHEYIVLTDHSARLTVAHGLTRDRHLRQLEEVAAVNEAVAPFRVLTGIEVDINEDGSLDGDDDLLDHLDVVVASVHSKLRMERQAMTQRMVLAAANPRVDILGHCTGRKVTGKGRDGSDADFDLVFAACARFDKAVEINCRPERLDPPRALIARALEIGCRFSIDTDAHATGQLEWQPYGANRAAEMGVPADRIVNTGGAEDLVNWAHSHR